MTAFVALLRGVNLGKRQLKMADLRRIGDDLGLGKPATFIASGNLLFDSDRSEDALKQALETSLGDHMGAPVGVMIRTSEEMASVVAANPFREEPGNRVVVIFLDSTPPKDATSSANHADGERITPGRRELYVHYPNGQGSSKLAIPAVANGTARNMNSVAKIADLLEDRS